MNRPEPRSIAFAPGGLDGSASRPPSDVAIVGMSAIMPGAGDVRTFWENTLRKRDAIVEIPADRWDWRLYYDADPRAPDKIVSKWGGFVPDVPFDPLHYGMPPSSLPSIEPVQLLLLEATRSAIDDAGYADRPFDRERTAVVLGMGGGAAQLAMGYAFRSYLPMLDTVTPGAGRDAIEACQGLLPEWTEDSFPGFLLNVAAGRVANRFDLGGANYTVDAACGSSLAAAALAVRELETGSADVVLLGGADTVQNPFTYLAFSKTHAFSPRGHCRPFDASADGIVISEGVAVLVLKRLADAERDGDRVYAVIKGVGASSDGRARGLTAPSPEGQVRAVERAYARAGVDPATIGYVEAHGTGTAVGDVVEVNAIAGVYRDHGVASGNTAIGSVKSMIGHTKCAAGLAGLINASLALHHKVLPPTINVETVNPKADLLDGPFRVNTETRPWLHDRELPRRAAVSAFGFGGTNFHAVLEAHGHSHTSRTAPLREWPAELFAWGGEGLIGSIDSLSAAIDAGAHPSLRDLARSVNQAFDLRASSATGPRLAIVATSLDDLRDKLRSAREAIASRPDRFEDPRGVFFEASIPFAESPVAFLFPGQGSQSPGMLSDLALAFPEIREAFEEADATLAGLGHRPVGPLAFPHPATDEATREAQWVALRASEAAQPALAAASLGLLRVLKTLGIEPGMVAGHSFGELTALQAAGSLSPSGLVRLAHDRGRLMDAALGDEPGSMAAIAAGRDRVARLIEGRPAVSAVNDNGPTQAVIAGPADDVAELVEAARSAGLRAQVLPVAGAFHTGAVAGASGPLAAAAMAAIGGPPDLPVYSNLDARPHPADPGRIAARLGEHLASPVRFAAMVDAMHAGGARVFVEVGPGSVLSPLVDAILGDRPHLAASCDPAGKPGVAGFLRTLARLVVAGVPGRLGPLSEGRECRLLDLAHLPVGDGSPPPSPTTWLVNGTRARPIGQPEPRRLGQGPALPLPAPARVETPAHRYGSANGNGNGNGNGHLTTLLPSIPTRNGGKTMNPTATSPPSPAPVLPLPSSSADERVMAAFQETMRTFLDVQRSTMLAYLAGRPAATPSTVPDVLASRATRTPTARVSPEEIPPVAPARSAGPPANGTVHTSAPADPEPEPPAAKAPAAVEIAPSPATAGPVGRDAVAARLVEIVRDRTGYPAEMLGFDLDLEADLGIDSIKRVEILGTLRDSVPALEGSADSSTMDALSRAKTLGAIVDRVEEISKRLLANGQVSEPVPKSVVRTESSKPPEPRSPVRRMTIEAVAAPLGRATSGLARGGVVLVTDDGRGVARALATDLQGSGHRVEVAGAGDLASPSAVDRLLRKARESGELAGIVHALPLREAPAPGLDPAAWASRMGPEVKGLFLLARGAAADLERAGRRGGGALIAATAMGGTFGSLGGRDFFAGQGGVAGLVKTLAREWPGVRARVVDFDPGRDARWLADRLAAETLADDDWAEVGYDGDRRVRLSATPSALVASSNGFEMSPGGPIVVTGGARGITATLVLELARRWRPTLLLLGRSPLPAESEGRETSGIESPSELKAAIHGKLRRSGGAVTPGDVERAYQGVRQAREIRANLGAFRRAGAEVEYAGVDVRDGSALAPVLEAWRARFGDPAGLIHGAGVIKDKLIRDKTPEMFDEVLATKLDGALNLARLLNPDAIKFAALFSSIAGRFGNAGQSDYAAANEVLNKLAIWLDRRWPGRIVAMNWGPWSGVGMVAELEGHLGARGLGMIPPEVGRTLLLDELRHGRKGVVEVVAAADLGGLDGPSRSASPRPRRVVGAGR